MIPYETYGWNLEGYHVKANYLDYSVTGNVELSRVAYGGKVVHTIVLDKPQNFYGGMRTRAIINHQDIVSLSDH